MNESCPVFIKVKESTGETLNLNMFVPVYMVKSEELFEVIGNTVQNPELLY